MLASDDADLSGESEDDPHVAIHPENLVYVIYTLRFDGPAQRRGEPPPLADQPARVDAARVRAAFDGCCSSEDAV